MPKQVRPGSRGAQKRVERLRITHEKLVAVAERAHQCAEEIGVVLAAAEAELAAAQLHDVEVVLETAESELATATMMGSPADGAAARRGRPRSRL